MTIFARGGLLELQPRLLASAFSRTQDVNLAHAVVHYTLMNLMRRVPPKGRTMRAADMVHETIDRMACFQTLRRQAADDQL